MSVSFLTRIKRLFERQSQPVRPDQPAVPQQPAAPSAAVSVAQQVQSTSPEIEKPIMLEIWMIERDRYGVRGRALSTEIEVYASEAVTLCEGVAGYVLHAPSGETLVAEGRSGGLIGSSLEAVLDDVRDMPSAELIRQIDSNRKEFNRMKREALSNEEFWAALRLADQEPETNQDY